ncbi:MAG: hypothetical protein IID18_07150 [Nitrospinae bacterium]|nr:hypothetical protein [Nitrospinota bacterium]
MPIDKAKSAIITILSFLCVLIMAVPVAAHSSAGGAADLGGTDSKGSYSYDKEQIHKGSSVGHGFMPRKSEGSRRKSPHHLSGSESPKTYSHGKSGHGSSYKKSEGSGSSYKKSEGSGSKKSYSHGKSGYSSGHGYSKGHGKKCLYRLFGRHIVASVLIEPPSGERLGYARCLERIFRDAINVILQMRS